MPRQKSIFTLNSSTIQRPINSRGARRLLRELSYRSGGHLRRLRAVEVIPLPPPPQQEMPMQAPDADEAQPVDAEFEDDMDYLFEGENVQQTNGDNVLRLHAHGRTQNRLPPGMNYLHVRVLEERQILFDITYFDSHRSHRRTTNGPLQPRVSRRRLMSPSTSRMNTSNNIIIHRQHMPNADDVVEEDLAAAARGCGSPPGVEEAGIDQEGDPEFDPDADGEMGVELQGDDRAELEAIGVFDRLLGRLLATHYRNEPNENEYNDENQM